MSQRNMKKWKIVLLVLLIVAVLISLTGDAHAAVDEYGNEIDWDVNGTGGEDSAGGEENYVPIDADILEQEREAQSESEAESLAALLESAGAEAETEVKTTGIVIVKFQAGEAWRGSNVSLIAYDQSMKKHEIYLYKQNGFEAREVLPCGVYTIYEARAVGDRNGLYPMMADMDKFEVTEGGQAVVINIELVQGVETKPSDIEETEVAEEAEVAKPETEEKGENRMNRVIMTAGILGICVVILIFIKRRKGENEDGEEVHNDW